MATQTLYALFQTVLDAERAIGALADHGIAMENIAVLAREPAEQPESERVRSTLVRAEDPAAARFGEPIVAYNADAEAPPPAVVSSTVEPTSPVDTPNNVEAVGKRGITTTTPGDAAAGAAIGTGIGLVAGMLATALAVTGVGLVGGILAAAVGATVATTAAGAVVGGVAGYLRDMGMPEHAAEHVADRLHEGDYLLSVRIDSTDYDAIQQILNKYNSVGVDTEDTLVERPVQAALTSAPVPVITPEESARELDREAETETMR